MKSHTTIACLTASILFVASPGIAGTSIPVKGVTTYKPTSAVVYLPALDTEAEVDIGQTIVSKLKLIVHPAVTLKEGVSFKTVTGFFDNDWSGTATIKPGVMLRYLENSEGAFYQDKQATFTFTAGTVKADGGIFVPNDRSKLIVPWKFSKSTIYFGDDPVSIEMTSVESWEADSFRKELIYGGVSQGVITIIYKEFLDNTARPAFTQEVKYDLAQGDVIGYRGARFKVLKAGNTGLLYKVLRPLD